MIISSTNRGNDNDFQLTLGHDIVAESIEVKDLGIIIGNDITFTSHVNSVLAKASVRANLIHKCFTSRDSATLLKAYTVYVRPILEYASCVWSPAHKTAVRRIESVQRKFTKRLPGLSGYDYKSRLDKLGIESLEQRRLNCDFNSYI
jgi:hypothetical protein